MSGGAWRPHGSDRETPAQEAADEYASRVIVVCGNLAGNDRRRNVDPAAIAAAAARGGVEVQLIAVVPEGPAGDACLIALAQADVGHVAVLRASERPLEAADVDLALRYLPDTKVVVTVGLAGDVLAAASERSTWSGAFLIVLEAPDAPMDVGEAAAEADSAAVVLRAPASDPDGTFAGFIGAFAARIGRGEVPADAWAATTRALAVDAVGGRGRD